MLIVQLAFVVVVVLHPVGHTTTLHSLELLAQATFLDLALFLLLGAFKVSLVAKIHQMSALVDFSFESTKGTFDGLSISDGNLDIDIQRSDRSFCGKGKNTEMGGKWVRRKSARRILMFGSFTASKKSAKTPWKFGPKYFCLEPETGHL